MFKETCKPFLQEASLTDDDAEALRTHELPLLRQELASLLPKPADKLLHDLNNLLTAIMGSAEMADRCLPPDSEAAEHLEKIIQVAGQAGELVHRLSAQDAAGDGIAEPPDKDLEEPTAPLFAAQDRQMILLVEDEPMVRRLAAQTLRSQGYAVQEAANGQEALDLLDTISDAITLLITDMAMPQMGGQEIAGHCAARWPESKILFITGFMEPSLLPDMITGHRADLLRKPFTPGDLTRRVQAILEHA